jgi:uncharacterized protein
MQKQELVLAALAASNGAAHTPVQVQKLFFLLDRKIPSLVGGPHFNFNPDDYGPFDSDVYSVLESLERVGDVEIERVADLRKKMYRATPIGQEKGEALLSRLAPDVRDYIEKLSGWVRKLSFAQLVTAIYAEYPDMKANSIFRQ